MGKCKHYNPFFCFSVINIKRLLLFDKEKKGFLKVLVICGLHLFQSLNLCCLLDGEERTYGGCEGPDAMYVKLISSDGHEFIVKREHALTSGTIKAMLSGPGEIQTHSGKHL